MRSHARLVEDDARPQPRVLMIDDDPLIGVMFSRLLSPFRVTFAQSAAGALARIQAGGNFAAVLCDIYMPGMNGIRFYEEVGKISQRLADRIVFMSSSPSAPDAADFLRRTRNAFLVKPVGSEALKNAVLTASRR